MLGSSLWPHIGSAADVPAPSNVRQGVPYDVTITAPDAERALLTNNLSLIRWRGTNPLDATELEVQFNEGKDEIARLLASEGYYNPIVKGSLTLEHKVWQVRYDVVPGTITTVAHVAVRFEGTFAEVPACAGLSAPSLKAGWALPVGRRFRHADWETAKRTLLQQLLLRCYPLARYESTQARVNAASNEADLELVVALGPLVRFGDLAVSGLHRYPANTVTNLNPIEPGTVFQQQLLFDYQRRLAASGYFSHADVAAAADPTTAIAPVTVHVEENKLQQINTSIGYSTNTLFRSRLDYTYLNVADAGIQARTQLDIESLKQSAGVGLTWPTTVEGYHDAVNAQITRQDIQDQTTRSALVSAKRSWGDDRLQQVLELDYLVEHAAVPQAFDITARALAGSFTWTARRTDDLVDPSSGHLVSTQVMAGVRPNDFDPFARLYGRYLQYLPLTVHDVILVRGEAGALIGHDVNSIPQDYLWRTGGDQSVRGYGYLSLGEPIDGAVIGARYLAVGSVEGDHYLSGSLAHWGLAAFVDAGNAADSLAALAPRVGYGTGVRWRSPVGILHLDVARGVSNHSTRVHFSLGVSF